MQLWFYKTTLWNLSSHFEVAQPTSINTAEAPPLDTVYWGVQRRGLGLFSVYRGNSVSLKALGFICTLSSKFHIALCPLQVSHLKFVRELRCVCVYKFLHFFSRCTLNSYAVISQLEWRSQQTASQFSLEKYWRERAGLDGYQGRLFFSCTIGSKYIPSQAEVSWKIAERWVRTLMTESHSGGRRGERGQSVS